jgi:hypothetical protein
MAGKYDKYIHPLPHVEISAGDDLRVVFNGNMVDYRNLGYPLTIGLQFVTKPFLSDNPCHTHNFQEFLAWYGGNPRDPEDFGAEVVFYFGKEMEKHVFTRPTMVNLPPGLPHCPLEVTRVDSPILQLEIMLTGEGGTREPYFEKDRGYKPVKFKVLG